MTTPRTPVEPPQYRLEHEPDGSSWTARENLADILERELLGPMNGPDEVIDGAPDAVYLVGRIAPFKLAAGTGDPQDADTGEPDTDVGDADDAEAGRGVPLTEVDDSGAGADEDSGLEDTPQQRGLMIPASMGLRCQIPDDLESFTVTASWGVYESVPAPEGDESRIRRYKRTPVEIPKRIVVADLGESVTTEIPLKDKVVLRIDRHDEPERNCRLIEIALCNDRVAPRKIPVRRLAVPDEAHRDGGGRARVPAGHRSAAGRPLGAGRRASAAEAAVPGPARVRGRAYLLGRLARGRGRSPGEQGVDDVAAGERDAAGRRRGSRCPARHAQARRRIPGRAPHRAVADRGASTRSGSTARKRGRRSFPITCATRAWTRSTRRGRCRASSRPGLSTFLATRTRCGASGS